MDLNKTDKNTIVLTARLPFARAYDVPVSMVISGGHSNYEDHGLGKHYNVYCSGASASISNTAYEETTISFNIPTGSLSYYVMLDIVNNEVVELDREITISGTFNGREISSKSFTIIDDNRDYLINVTSQASLDAVSPATFTPWVADDATDNTTAAQELINWLNTNSKKAVLYLPNGTYRMEQVAFNDQFITLWGESEAGTIIKRIDGTDSRLDRNAHLFKMAAINSATDTDPIAVNNVTLDGNDTHFWGIFTINSNIANGKYYEFNLKNLNIRFTFQTTPDPDAAPLYYVQIGASKEATMANWLAKLNSIDGFEAWMQNGTSETVMGIAYTAREGFYFGSTSLTVPGEMSIVAGEALSLFYSFGNVGGGYTRFFLENITMQNSPGANGFQFVVNNEVHGYRVGNDKDDLIARGGFCLGAGKFYFKEIESDYFHCEADTDGYGADPQLVLLYVDGLDCYAANFGIAGDEGMSANARGLIQNVTVRKHWSVTSSENVPGPGCFEFRDCNFTTGYEVGYDGWTISTAGAYPGTGPAMTGVKYIEFYDCTFTVVDDAIGSYIRGCIPWVHTSGGWPAAGGGRVLFEDCSFDGSRTGADGCLTSYVGRISTAADNENDNIITFTRPTFGSGLDYGFMTGHTSSTYLGSNGIGGIYVITDPIVNSPKFLYQYGRDDGAYANTNLTITGGTYNMASYFWDQYGWTSTSYGQNNIIRMKDINLTAAQNIIGTTQGLVATNVDTPDDTNVMRYITGYSGNPKTNKPAGYCGGGSYDKIRTTVDTYYKCTATGHATVATWASYTPMEGE